MLAAIADPTCTRDDVAVDYAAALLAYGPSGEWREINEAIIERWSMSALRYIKEKAWKIVRSRDRQGTGDGARSRGPGGGECPARP